MKSLTGSKIVVTGGGGFIGSHIVDALLEEGALVTVIDDFSTGRRDNLAHVASRIELIEKSILEPGIVEKAAKGAFAIVHQAAIPSVPKSIERPLESHAANSSGTLAVLDAARKAGVDRVIYATSSSVYGDTAVLPKVETMSPDPLSPYAVQKLTAELYAKIYYSLHGLKTIGLRYFNVFGPRQDPNGAYAAVIPKFVSLIASGKKPQIYGDGSTTRDFTYIDNVVKANLLALKTEKGFGEAFNIAGGNQISLNELVAKINAAFNSSIAAEYLPPKKGDIKDSYADISKAQSILGFETMVSFDEGLKRTIESLT